MLFPSTSLHIEMPEVELAGIVGVWSMMIAPVCADGINASIDAIPNRIVSFFKILDPVIAVQ